MFQLVYASTAARPMQPEDLEAILEIARTKNARLGVTGMLLYHDERFLQALEGAEDAVRGLYDTIRQDERHTAVITLRERALDARDFPDWSMGFTNLARARPEDLPEGYVPFMSGDFTPEHFRENPSQVHQTLLQFRDAAAGSSPAGSSPGTAPLAALAAAGPTFTGSALRGLPSSGPGATLYPERPFAFRPTYRLTFQRTYVSADLHQHGRTLLRGGRSARPR